jgi:hypothetical protein
MVLGLAGNLRYKDCVGEGSINCELHIRLLVRECVPYQQSRTFLVVIKMCSMSPDGCLRPRETGRLTISFIKTMILSLNFV